MADRWFDANREDLGKFDPISELLEPYEFDKGTRILEIGCANGWRLAKFKERYPGIIVAGLDPSQKAIASGRQKWDLDLRWGTADNLAGLYDQSFDLVIFGFPLYMIHPTYWFQVVAESDRVLKNGGHLIVHDYANPVIPYVLVERLGIDNPHWGFHADFTRFWLAHPFYSLRAQAVRMSDTTHPQTIFALHKKPEMFLATHDRRSA